MVDLFWAADCSFYEDKGFINNRVPRKKLNAFESPQTLIVIDVVRLPNPFVMSSLMIGYTMLNCPNRQSYGIGTLRNGVSVGWVQPNIIFLSIIIFSAQKQKNEKKD